MDEVSVIMYCVYNSQDTGTIVQSFSSRVDAENAKKLYQEQYNKQNRLRFTIEPTANFWR